MPTAIAEPATNAATIVASAHELAEQGVGLAVYPELCLSGYALEDLLLTASLLEGVEVALATLADGTADLAPVIVVGAPLPWRNRVYNLSLIHI